MFKNHGVVAMGEKWMPMGGKGEMKSVISTIGLGTVRSHPAVGMAVTNKRRKKMRQSTLDLKFHRISHFADRQTSSHHTHQHLGE
ncbi:hypothetical protein HAP94_24530 [Acidithiobacillus ferrivorans]|nr:hypothetical protein [Acidithiobacillus ferrivorans]